MLARRVVQRYLTARYTKPRSKWPDEEANAYAVRVTKEAERHGHDLGQWKRLNGRWVAKCVQCTMQFEIQPKDSKYSLIPNEHYSLHTQTPMLIKGDWETDRCEPITRDYIRGLLLEMEDPAAVLNQSHAAVRDTLLRLLLSRPLGRHWTKPSNKAVALSFSEWNEPSRAPGISVIIHAQYNRADQKRSYRPAPRESGEEYDYEDERFMGKGEVLRLQKVEWYDGNQWLEADLGGVKARA